MNKEELAQTDTMSEETPKKGRRSFFKTRFSEEKGYSYSVVDHDPKYNFFKPSGIDLEIIFRKGR